MRIRLVEQQEQRGFVAIIVAAFIMIILSLITLGFTRLMQREQRQALDRQLTRQALYAAESGINDVYKYLKDNQGNAAVPAEKTTCDVSSAPAINEGNISTDKSVAYTCALYDKTPTELVYSLSTTDSKIVELKTDSGRNFSSLLFRWGNEQGNNDVSSLPSCGVSADTFPTARAGQIPLLRADLTDVGILSRDQLIAATDNLYIVPCKGSISTVTHQFLSKPKGTIIQVPCDSSKPLPCEVTLTGLTAATYVLRIRSIYDSAQVVVSAQETTGPSSTDVVEFKQAQTSIDVTAKASDIVRRLRVAIPFAEVKNPPEAVFQSFDGICKKLAVDLVSSPATVKDTCSY